MHAFQPLRVLILEDKPSDAELMVDELRQAGFEPDWRRVDTEADYLAHLDPVPDIILADYSLPQWDAPHALRALQERGLDVPFVMVSGTVGEDVAVECIKQGAADYLLKDRMARLGSAVVKALEDKRLRAEKRQAEAELKRLKEFNENIVQTMAEGIILQNAEGVFTFVNPAAAAIMGYTPEELVGQHWTAVIPPDQHAAIHAADERRKRGAFDRYEVDVVCKDGARRTVWVSGSPRFEEGRFVATMAVFTDITERKQAEEALRASEERLRTVLENMPVMLDALDDKLNIIVWNRECERVTGYTAEEIINHPNVSELLYPDPHYRAHMQTELTSSDDYRNWEWKTTCKDGSIKTIAWFNISRQCPVPGWARWGIGVDITERKRAEEEIRRLNTELEQRVKDRTAQLNHAKDRIEAILNSTNDIIILCRTDGAIEQVNPAFDTTFHCGSDEVFLQPLTQLVSPQQVSPLEQAFKSVVETRQPARLEVSVYCKQNAVFDADMMLSPIVQRDGRLSGVVCSLRNITERRQMEAQLRQMLQHEMELGELKSRYVSMAAHDLRNPLAVIQSAIDIIQQYSSRLTDEQKQTKYNHMRASIKVMVDLLDDILTIGQVESGKLTFNPAPVDVIAFCQNLAAEIKQATGTTQHLDFSSEGECGIAHLDAKLLRHILSNLLSNAIKYSPDERPVTFKVSCSPDQITFHIQDQGIGIPEDDHARLFEAFHRASNARQIPGTGLGLTIVKQSVDLHGGTITFKSEEGIGTTFTVILPQTPAEK